MSNSYIVRCAFFIQACSAGPKTPLKNNNLDLLPACTKTQREAKKWMRLCVCNIFLHIHQNIYQELSLAIQIATLKPR